MLGMMVAAALTAAAPAAVQTMQVGATTLTVPVPAGFCPPAGDAQRAQAEALAAADDTNATLATMFACEGTVLNANYVLIKAPKRTLDQTVERPALLDAMAEAMKLPQFTAPDAAKTNDPVERQLEKALGVRPNIEGVVTPLGRDDTCVYMGGVLSLTAGSLSYKRAVSLCITSVGGKILGVYRYSEGEPANVARHLGTARAIALTITPRK